MHAHMQTHTNSTYPKGYHRESGVRDDWPSANMLVLSFWMLYIIRVLSYEDFSSLMILKIICLFLSMPLETFV